MPAITIPETLDNYAVLGNTNVINSGISVIIDGKLGSNGAEPIGVLYSGTNSEYDGLNVSAAQLELTQLLTVEIPSVITTETIFNPIIDTGATVFTSGKYRYPNGFELVNSDSEIVFDAQNDSNAQFILTAESLGILITNGKFSLINGAVSSNIFIVSDNNINILKDSFNAIGNLMATNSIVLNKGVKVYGKLYSQNSFVAMENNNINTIPQSDITVCYVRGTSILTHSGYIPIEDIKVGTPIFVRGDINKYRLMRNIHKINYRNVSLIKSFKVNMMTENSRPICISKNAFGDNVPMNNLYISPNHNLCINNFMVQAKQLINNTTIYQSNDFESVEYYHIELPKHSVILAEGVAAESYKDIKNIYAVCNTEKVDVSNNNTLVQL